MPAWSEYKRAAKERGSLAHELYVVVSTPIETPEKLKAVLPEHLSYQAEQEKNGSLVMAGPLSDLTGEQMQGMGMIIYRAASLDAAKAIAEADPMHMQGIRSFEIRRWLVNEGNLQLNIKLSEQTIAL